jgi:hypothetical protein
MENKVRTSAVVFVGPKAPQKQLNPWKVELKCVSLESISIAALVSSG